MKTRLVVLSLAVALLLAAAATAVAAPNQVIVRSVIAGGGQVSDGATLTVRSSIGEAIAGSPIVAGSHGSAAGFWPGLFSGDFLYLPVVAR